MSISGTSQIKIIDGTSYMPVWFPNPGDYIHFIAGNKIAVETFAVEAGTHDFNYEVNSRHTSNGNPESILTTENALKEEFKERRYVNRSFIPISADFSVGIKNIKADITYGEVTPAIYDSKVKSPLVAWSIEFKWHRLVMAEKIKKAKTARGKRKQDIIAARGTAALESLPDLNGHLRVYVPSSDIQKFSKLKQGFGTTDIIGTNSGIIEEWITRVFGR